MPKRAASAAASVPGKRRSRAPLRYHEEAAAAAEQQQAAGGSGSESGSDSDSDADGLARFTPAALDQPAKAVQQSLSKAKLKQPAATQPGVVYLGHIPHGFYEAQMRGFFSQFGDVSKLRLSRNKKTGRSRHYAFIEFADRHVAAVVAETMDGYLLCNKQLVCKVVDPEKLHERVWVGANKKFQKVPWRSIARNQLNQRRSAEKQRARQERLVQKENKKRAKLQKLGIDYEFEGYREALPKKPQRTRF